MHTIRPIIISNFFAAGINHSKADADIRGRFAVNIEQYRNILASAPSFGIDAFFVLSTCNRTEIYGFAETASQLIGLLCTQTTGDEHSFTDKAYIKSGPEAIRHLFKVGAGLDSQILGDYEIIGQLKQAVKLARENNFINCFLDRLVNNVLQASKKIKNDTSLSSGTVSVAFTAVQYIKQHCKIEAATNILMIGTGKIGRNTCKNMVDYLGAKNITLINRSVDKAVELASELNLKYAHFSEIDEHIRSANIILTATSAAEPTILKHQLQGSEKKLIIDLSIPYNVEGGVGELPGITLINIDTLSNLKDQTLQQRMAEIPKAKSIIEHHMAEFMEWYVLRKNAAALNAAKTRLNEINLKYRLFELNDFPFCPQEQIQSVLNLMANKMLIQNQHGCQYIEAINEFMERRPIVHAVAI